MPRKTMDKYTACRVICNVMTNKGFMNGWLGDRSDEFKRDQASDLFSLKRGKATDYWTAEYWLENNHFNMTRHCRIPRWVIDLALS